MACFAAAISNAVLPPRGIPRPGVRPPFFAAAGEINRVDNPVGARRLWQNGIPVKRPPRLASNPFPHHSREMPYSPPPLGLADRSPQVVAAVAFPSFPLRGGAPQKSGPYWIAFSINLRRPFPQSARHMHRRVAREVLPHSSPLFPGTGRNKLRKPIEFSPAAARFRAPRKQRQKTNPFASNIFNHLRFARAISGQPDRRNLPKRVPAPLKQRSNRGRQKFLDTSLRHPP